MKTILLFWLCALPLYAVELLWDAVTTNVDGSAATNLAGYRVYVGQQSRQYLTNFTTTNTSFQIANTNLFNGANYFAVTAFDTGGLESDFSDEVFYTKPNAPPRAPLNLRILGTNDVGKIRLLQSSTGEQWTETGQVFVPVANGPTAFYKAAAPAPAKQFVSAPPVKSGKLIVRKPPRPFVLPPMPK